MDVEFGKKYSSIQADSANPFHERMQFDIYRRATKDARLEGVKKVLKTTLDSREEEELISRLQRDAGRRSAAKVYLERHKDDPSSCSSPGLEEKKRRMSCVEAEEFYQRLIESKKATEDAISAKRKLIEQTHDEEEKQILDSQISAHREPLKKAEVDRMLQRFSSFGKMAQKKLEIRRRTEQEKAERETKKMFKPHINKDWKNEMSVFDEAVGGLTVYERMQLDVASKKLRLSREKYEKIKRGERVGIVAVEIPKSPQRHTKVQLDLDQMGRKKM